MDLGSHLKGEIIYCISHQRIESCLSEETEEGQRNFIVQGIQLSWPYSKSWQALDKGACGMGGGRWPIRCPLHGPGPGTKK